MSSIRLMAFVAGVMALAAGCAMASSARALPPPLPRRRRWRGAGCS